MSKFVDETMQGLEEAVAIEKGEIQLIEKEDMPGKTFVCKDIKKKSMDFKGNYSDNKL
jgi:hypothetical protein